MTPTVQPVPVSIRPFCRRTCPNSLELKVLRAADPNSCRWRCVIPDVGPVLSVVAGNWDSAGTLARELLGMPRGASLEVRDYAHIAVTEARRVKMKAGKPMTIDTAIPAAKPSQWVTTQRYTGWISVRVT